MKNQFGDVRGDMTEILDQARKDAAFSEELLTNGMPMAKEEDESDGATVRKCMLLTII
ncbi:hypothetical protein [Chondromyces crocatus]|uniref:Uncharacterized protein n=1 Tax=Chondromyces crocatus TaxID=52 RepID=A0A0K1EHQ9_CHOCO|nr:hypothetical protein [Chondromyces crocatus]AKT40113.1 uncharacterized protein CMC5_042660 [Chondromyces crocatus]